MRREWLTRFGVLALCALVSRWEWNRRGHLNSCKSNVCILSSALECYASDHGGRYPKRLGVLVRHGYLRSIPTCPTAGFDTYSASYQCCRQPEEFSLGCRGRRHGEPPKTADRDAFFDRQLSSSKGYPWYDTEAMHGFPDVP